MLMIQKISPAHLEFTIFAVLDIDLPRMNGQELTCRNREDAELRNLVCQCWRAVELPEAASPAMAWELRQNSIVTSTTSV